MSRQWGLLLLMLALFGLEPVAVAEPGGGSEERGHRHEHGFKNAERWSRHFDAPERAAWQRADEVIAFLGLEGDERVVDLGAGTGYFTLPLARALHAGGAVVAVDIEPDMLAFIEKRAGEEGLRNISTVLGASDDPHLDPGSVDLVLCVNTWHHIAGRSAYAGKLASTLREGGRVVIVDFREGDLPVGPPADHKLSPADVREEFEVAGFAQVATFDELEYQYVLVFAPEVSSSPQRSSGEEPK